MQRIRPTGRPFPSAWLRGAAELRFNEGLEVVARAPGCGKLQLAASGQWPEGDTTCGVKDASCANLRASAGTRGSLAPGAGLPLPGRLDGLQRFVPCADGSEQARLVLRGVSGGSPRDLFGRRALSDLVGWEAVFRSPRRSGLAEGATGRPRLGCQAGLSIGCGPIRGFAPWGHWEATAGLLAFARLEPAAHRSATASTGAAPLGCRRVGEVAPQAAIAGPPEPGGAPRFSLVCGTAAVSAESPITLRHRSAPGLDLALRP